MDPMDYRPTLNEEQKAWLHAHAYEILSFVARGRSAGIWLVERNGKRFVAKAEHSHSTRMGMLAKEARFLKTANESKLGPRLVHVDVPHNMMVMEFIEGIPLGKWLKENKSKLKLQKVMNGVFAQAKKLDAVGLDHGQLGGKLHNVLVSKKGDVWIIDFEKASEVRAPQNVRVLEHELLSGKTLVSKHARELLGEKSANQLIERWY